MSTVGMHEAKTRLSQLVQEVEAGGRVTITRHGEPVAQLVRVDAATNRGFGAMAGRSRVAELTIEDVEAGDAEVAAMFPGTT
jgi:prevent-host-death family protein